MHNYAMSITGLALDYHWTHLDLAPMPRGTICIPFTYLSNLLDPLLIGNDR